MEKNIFLTLKGKTYSKVLATVVALLLCFQFPIPVFAQDNQSPVNPTNPNPPAPTVDPNAVPPSAGQVPELPRGISDTSQDFLQGNALSPPAPVNPPVPPPTSAAQATTANIPSGLIIGDLEGQNSQIQNMRVEENNLIITTTVGTHTISLPAAGQETGIFETNGSNGYTGFYSGSTPVFWLRNDGNGQLSFLAPDAQNRNVLFTFSYPYIPPPVNPAPPMPPADPPVAQNGDNNGNGNQPPPAPVNPAPPMPPPAPPVAQNGDNNGNGNQPTPPQESAPPPLPTSLGPEYTINVPSSNPNYAWNTIEPQIRAELIRRLQRSIYSPGIDTIDPATISVVGLSMNRDDPQNPIFSLVGPQTGGTTGRITFNVTIIDMTPLSTTAPVTLPWTVLLVFPPQAPPPVVNEQPPRVVDMAEETNVGVQIEISPSQLANFLSSKGINLDSVGTSWFFEQVPPNGLLQPGGNGSFVYPATAAGQFAADINAYQRVGTSNTLKAQIRIALYVFPSPQQTQQPQPPVSPEPVVTPLTPPPPGGTGSTSTIPPTPPITLPNGIQVIGVTGTSTPTIRNVVVTPHSTNTNGRITSWNVSLRYEQGNSEVNISGLLTNGERDTGLRATDRQRRIFVRVIEDQNGNTINYTFQIFLEGSGSSPLYSGPLPWSVPVGSAQNTNGTGNPFASPDNPLVFLPSASNPDMGTMPTFALGYDPSQMQMAMQINPIQFLLGAPTNSSDNVIIAQPAYLDPSYQQIASMNSIFPQSGIPNASSLSPPKQLPGYPTPEEYTQYYSQYEAALAHMQDMMQATMAAHPEMPNPMPAMPPMPWPALGNVAYPTMTPSDYTKWYNDKMTEMLAYYQQTAALPYIPDPFSEYTPPPITTMPAYYVPLSSSNSNLQLLDAAAPSTMTLGEIEAARASMRNFVGQKAFDPNLTPIILAQIEQADNPPEFGQVSTLMAQLGNSPIPPQYGTLPVAPPAPQLPPPAPPQFAAAATGIGAGFATLAATLAMGQAPGAQQVAAVEPPLPFQPGTGSDNSADVSSVQMTPKQIAGAIATLTAYARERMTGPALEQIVALIGRIQTTGDAGRIYMEIFPAMTTVPWGIGALASSAAVALIPTHATVAGIPTSVPAPSIFPSFNVEQIRNLYSPAIERLEAFENELPADIPVQVADQVSDLWHRIRETQRQAVAAALLANMRNLLDSAENLEEMRTVLRNVDGQLENFSLTVHNGAEIVAALAEGHPIFGHVVTQLQAYRSTLNQVRASLEQAQTTEQGRSLLNSVSGYLGQMIEVLQQDLPTPQTLEREVEALRRELSGYLQVAQAPAPEFDLTTLRNLGLAIGATDDNSLRQIRQTLQLLPLAPIDKVACSNSNNVEDCMDDVRRMKYRVNGTTYEVAAKGSLVFLATRLGQMGGNVQLAQAQPTTTVPPVTQTAGAGGNAGGAAGGNGGNVQVAGMFDEWVADNVQTDAAKTPTTPFVPFIAVSIPPAPRTAFEMPLQESSARINPLPDLHWSGRSQPDLTMTPQASSLLSPDDHVQELMRNLEQVTTELNSAQAQLGSFQAFTSQTGQKSRDMVQDQMITAHERAQVLAQRQEAIRSRIQALHSPTVMAPRYGNALSQLRMSLNRQGNVVSRLLGEEGNSMIDPDRSLASDGSSTNHRRRLRAPERAAGQT